MTGVAPGTSGSHTPIDIPAPGSEVTGEGGSAVSGGAPPGGVQIAYLHPGTVSHSWHQSLMNAIAYDKSLGANLIHHAPFGVSCSGPNSLVEARNMAVRHFLDNTQAEWLMFIDTDMGFEADAIERLVFAASENGRAVVGGLCFALKHVGPDGMGGFRVLPIPTLFEMGKNDEEGIGFVNRFRYPPDAMVKVAGTGAAFLLIHRKPLEEIAEFCGDEWFNMVQYENGKTVSEDLSFCFRLNQLNWAVYVHTGVKITHHKQFWLSEGDYRMPEVEPALRQMEAAKQVAE